MLRHPQILLTLLLLLALPAAWTAAQSAAAPGSRIIKTFDFEEQPLGNFDTVPMYWAKLTGRGYPLYTNGHFDTAYAHSASHSFKLQLDGGSIAYEYPAGRLPVSPDADYLIVGYVKTTKLVAARATISAWFADSQQQPIDGTLVSEVPYAAPTGPGDDWHLLHLYLPAHANAGSLVLQLGLLQPQQLTAATPGKFDLYQQDITGAAWFDDIAIYQLPRVVLHPAAAGGVFSTRAPIGFDLSISDLGHPRLAATLTVRDAAHAICGQQTLAITFTNQTWKQTVTLPGANGAAGLPQGWYDAELDVADGPTVVTRRETSFVVINATTTPSADSAFAIDAGEWPVDRWPELAALVAPTGAGAVYVPAWRKAMTSDQLVHRDGPLEALINQLDQDGIATNAVIAEIPDILRDKLQLRGNALDQLPPTAVSVWQPYLAFMAARFGNTVRGWHIGAVGRPTDPQQMDVFAALHQQMADQINPATIALPWTAADEPPSGPLKDDRINLIIPPMIPPEQIADHVAAFSVNRTPPTSLYVTPIADPIAGKTRIADFAQRVIAARATPIPTVIVRLPVDRAASWGSEVESPSELYLPLRTLIRGLSQQTFTGTMPLAGGLHVYLFERDSVGTLAMWADPDSVPVELDLPLGDHPIQTALDGSDQPLPVVAGLSHLTVTQTPILVSGIDPRLLKLSASFALGSPTLPAGTGVIDTTVKLANPYADPLSGRLQLHVPKGWTVDPNVLDINIAAGGDVALPITIRFPYSEPAGRKTIGGTLTLANNSDQPITLSTQSTLTSSIITMKCLADIPTPSVRKLEQVITNISAAPLNAQAYAMVEGSARQTRFIVSLQPGQTTIKHFTFPAAATGNAVFGVRQMDGTILLTSSIPLK